VSFFVEQFLGFVTLHPGLEIGDMFRMGPVNNDRNLMRAERSFDLQTLDHLRPGPTLWRSKHNHRPAGARRVVRRPGCLLDDFDIFDSMLNRCRHQAMHRFRVIAFHEIGIPTASAQELFQLFGFDPRKHGWIADLETVQMQDRQHGAVRDRIQ
jgi:hypothetical protein